MSVGAGRDWKSKKDKIDENIFSKNNKSHVRVFYFNEEKTAKNDLKFPFQSSISIFDEIKNF